MTNPKAFVEHPCIQSKDAEVTHCSMEPRLASYLQWIQITVKCSVYVDGQKVADVQTNNAARKRSQMVYETDDLAPGSIPHQTCQQNWAKAIATEGIYTLNNAGKGMFELKETTYEVQKANQSCNY